MRPEKEAIVGEIRTRAAQSAFVLIADYRGLKVRQFNGLRQQLRKGGAEVHVFKNRLMKVVAQERGWSALTPAFRGQSALVTGPDVVFAAKVLKQFTDENKVLAVKAGMLGETALSAADVAVLAALPSLQVLRGRLAGTVAAPLVRLVGVLQQKLSSVVYVLRAAEAKRSAA